MPITISTEKFAQLFEDSVSFETFAVPVTLTNGQTYSAQLFHGDITADPLTGNNLTTEDLANTHNGNLPYIVNPFVGRLVSLFQNPTISIRTFCEALQNPAGTPTYSITSQNPTTTLLKGIGGFCLANIGEEIPAGYRAYCQTENGQQKVIVIANVIEQFINDFKLELSKDKSLLNKEDLLYADQLGLLDIIATEKKCGKIDILFNLVGNNTDQTIHQFFHNEFNKMELNTLLTLTAPIKDSTIDFSLRFRRVISLITYYLSQKNPQKLIIAMMEQLFGQDKESLNLFIEHLINKTSPEQLEVFLDNFLQYDGNETFPQIYHALLSQCISIDPQHNQRAMWLCWLGKLLINPAVAFDIIKKYSEPDTCWKNIDAIMLLILNNHQNSEYTALILEKIAAFCLTHEQASATCTNLAVFSENFVTNLIKLKDSSSEVDDLSKYPSLVQFMSKLHDISPNIKNEIFYAIIKMGDIALLNTYLAEASIDTTLIPPTTYNGKKILPAELCKTLFEEGKINQKIYDNVLFTLQLHPENQVKDKCTKNIVTVAAFYDRLFLNDFTTVEAILLFAKKEYISQLQAEWRNQIYKVDILLEKICAAISQSKPKSALFLIEKLHEYANNKYTIDIKKFESLLKELFENHSLNEENRATIFISLLSTTVKFLKFNICDQNAQQVETYLSTLISRCPQHYADQIEQIVQDNKLFFSTPRGNRFFSTAPLSQNIAKALHSISPSEQTDKDEWLLVPPVGSPVTTTAVTINTPPSTSTLHSK